MNIATALQLVAMTNYGAEQEALEPARREVSGRLQFDGLADLAFRTPLRIVAVDQPVLLFSVSTCGCFRAGAPRSRSGGRRKSTAKPPSAHRQRLP